RATGARHNDGVPANLSAAWLEPALIETVLSHVKSMAYPTHVANVLLRETLAMSRHRGELPSEGKGDTFESCQARHFGTKLGTPKLAGFALSAATRVRRSTLFDPMMRSSFWSTSTRWASARR